MKNWLIACAAVLAPTAALAQGKAKPPDASDEANKAAVPPTELKEDEGPIPDPNVPDNLLSRLPRERGAAQPTHRYDKGDYPVELVKRPLTLAGEQLQVSLDIPFVSHDGKPTLTQVLRGAFGITRDLQVGLTYAFGLQRLSPDTGQDGYTASKAFSVDTAVTIFPQILAAELSFAFLAEPDQFGMAIGIGLPFKLELGDRWALFAGKNLVRFKVRGLPVDPADPEANQAELDLIGRGSPTTDGIIKLDLGAAFQARPEVAVFGTFGVAWPDFSTDRQPFSLFFGASYTAARRWDFGGRIGFHDLAHTGESFGLALFAAVRI
jgi:hypothetical protein